jgi:hypothetical protein
LKILLLAICLSLTACTTSSGVIPDGSNSYRVSHTGDTGFTNANTLKKNAYKEAAVYCDKKGKVVETIDMQSKQSRPFGGWPEAYLLFNCIERRSDI